LAEGGKSNSNNNTQRSS